SYIESQQRGEARARVLHGAYVRLSRLYASTLPATEKRAEKRVLLAKLAADLGSSRHLNNATLVQFRVYNSGAPELKSLLRVCEGSWPKFLAALKTLKHHTFS